MKNDIGYLVLENGKVYPGQWIGYKKEVVFECVFNTSMFGYTEMLSDPSYFGQGIVFSYPSIGNYGVNEKDMESNKCWASAMFCYDFCELPSNATTKLTLNEYLLKYKIPGLKGVNTRKIISDLRDQGVVRAKLTDNIKNIKKVINEIKNWSPANPLDYVPVKGPEIYGEGNKFNVALYDFGVKMNIVRELVKRNCQVTLFPPNYTYEQMFKTHPDGFVISNGPCDPKDNINQIAQIKKMIDKDLPILGICLGHQMIGLASGFDTKKLKYGHRGANHPCTYVDKKSYLTSQNHGYYIDNKTVDPKKVIISFINNNDHSVEGMVFKNKKYIETTQFHPEACAGPRDTNFIFDNFVNALKKYAK